MKRKLLFLSHSASRNGASILLLHFLQWMKAHTNYGLEVLCSGDGPLVADYRTVAHTRILRNPVRVLRAIPPRWANPLASSLQAHYLDWLMRRQHYDLVYANTAAAWPHVASITKGRCPVLWHIHELPYALQLTVNEQRGHAAFTSASRLVAVSQPVVDSLLRDFAVSGDRVDMVHGFVPRRDISAHEHRRTRQLALASLGWPDDSFVVGGCGGLGWRKGTDLFLQIARLTCADDRYANVRFLWVGGGHANDIEVLQFEHDLRALGLSHRCRRVPSTPSVDDYYCTMDVFALPSREDPFPLVMLEAATHGLPTVCFASSGGGPEFVGDDGGLVVPYLDLDRFSHALVSLHASPDRRKALGHAAQQKVHAFHSVEAQGPKLLRSIERCLAQV